MNFNRPSLFAAILFPLLTAAAPSDSVDVTFRYSHAGGRPAVVYLAGEFNRWGDNAGGVISNPSAAMTFDETEGVWVKTVRLRVGGPDPLPDPGRSVAGAYQYKFNENGGSSGWKADPLNPAQNPQDNYNSLIYARNPTLFRLLPNDRSGLVTSAKPEVTAFLFPAAGSAIDTSSIAVTVDGVAAVGLGSGYDPDSHRFRFIPATGLRNGAHTVFIRAACEGGEAVSDSATFTVRAGAVVLFTRPDTMNVRGRVTAAGTVSEGVTGPVTVFRNGDSLRAAVTAGGFSETVILEEGDNLIRAAVTDGDGIRRFSDSVVVRVRINHAPRPTVTAVIEGGDVRLTARGNDPDGDAVRFEWQPDIELNPLPLTLLSRDSVIVIRLPLPAGDWAFRVTAEDGDGNIGRSGAYFTVRTDGSVVLPDADANPQWVRDAVIYEIYLPAFTAEGTLAAAEARLPAIRSLGANVVWLMPLYENGETVNEGNAGYNITDFYSVHPQFGTLDDLDRFVRTAHGLGIRVILDSTPNHVSEKHPWVQDVLQWGGHSPFRPVIENRVLGDNRGMGQSAFRKDGAVAYVYYDGWSLANLNYTAPETNVLMTDMYAWWLTERNVDGFRMDVYWGPQNRYGSAAWWRPFREEMKRLKPGSFLLGETDGTGAGSEANYADGGGACDAAYDWNFFNQARQTLAGGSVGDLDLRVRNYSPSSRVNHHTGPNARYFRFLENHDETRIAQSFPAARTKAAAAVLCTAPGIPLIYAGQETGETSRRGSVDWERPGGAELTAWYSRLLSIRGRFAAFRSDDIIRVPCGSARIYAFLRPDSSRPGITVANFSGTAVQATLNLAAVPLFSGEGEAALYFNDLLNDTCYGLTPGERASFTLTVPPYGAAVLVLADSILNGVSSRPAPAPESPGRLLKAFPNPFNSATRFSYRIDAGITDTVTLTLYDMLGRPVRVLALGRGASEGTAEWDGCDGNGRPAASGVYLCRLTAGDRQKTLKVAVLR